MVQGYPLQYYYDYPSPVEPYRTDFQYSYYNKYDHYTMTEISEEMIMPTSPHSIQSDSDNSMSSTDVTSKSITLLSPVKSFSKKTDVKCGWKQCSLWFESLDQLANHVSKAHASSGPSGLFYCGWEGCSRNNKGFNARYKMLVHVRTHTNEKPHQCCQCDKSFSRAENLKIHSRSHSGEKPYVCPVPGCNKAYSNSSDRFKHTRTHQVEKPYLCKVPGCPKRYTDPSSLRKHVKTYKHFVYDQQLKSEVPPDITNTTKSNIIVNSDENHRIIPKVDNFVNIDNTINTLNINKNVFNTHNCSCPHSCCLKNCLSKAAELIKLGELINFNNGNNIIENTWKKLLLDPLINPPRQIYNEYANEDCMEIDVDSPLDLTVHRK